MTRAGSQILCILDASASQSSPDSAEGQLRERHEILYLRTVDELERRLAVATPHDVLRCTLLVRQLLYDGRNGLAQRCNRTRRTPLRFQAGEDGFPELSKILSTAPLLHFQNPDVSEFPGARSKLYKLDAFMALHVLNYRGSRFTVKDILDFCAYVLGGIHFGEPRNAEDHLLLELEEIAQNHVGETTPALLALHGIARVVLAGLRPLTEAIRT